MLAVVQEAFRDLLDLQLYVIRGEQDFTRMVSTQCKCGEASMKQLQPVDRRTQLG